MSEQPVRKMVSFEHAGHKFCGYVITAINWGTKENPDWYVEWYEREGRDAEGKLRRYGGGYVKQQYDNCSNFKFWEE